MDEINSEKYSKNVKAYIQILPSTQQCWDDVKISENNKTLYVRCPQDFGKGKISVSPNYWTFLTDGILHNLNQTEIYDSIIFETLKNAVAGVDVLIFAYGQTGTGKSSTISGLQNTFEGRGLAPRIIADLFELKEKCKHESNLKYSVSYVEISKNSLVDLLKKDGNRSIHSPFKNLHILKIKSEYEGLKHLFHGEAERNVHSNVAYASHLLTSVFTIHIKNCSILYSNPVKKISKIHIIDMAGIDTDGNLSCQWKRPKEIGIANLNKSQLEQCLMMLQEDLVKNKCQIKDAGILVDFLGNSLKPQSVIRFIGHIRTTRDDLHVTLSVLRFANTARNIKSAKLTPFITKSPSLLINNLQHELDELKKQNYLNSMIMNKDLSCNITQNRLEQMQKAVDNFIKNKSNDIELLNVTDASVAVKIFKNICNKLDNERQEALKQIPPKFPSLQINSKTSAASTPSAAAKNRGSRTSRTVSHDSQISKKRKSFDKVSKKSKQSSSQELKSNLVGSLTRSGVSLGQLMSFNYQGNVTKSLKMKSKLMVVKSMDSSEESIQNSSFDKSSDTVSQKISEINIQTDLGDDYESVWNAYKMDENYKFTEMNATLQIIEENSKELLKQYNDTVNKLQNTVYNIDKKKNDLLKIQLYKESSNLKCESNDAEKLSDVQENLAMKIIELLNDTISIKEELLTMQTDLKINIEDYHRLKYDIKEDFKNFCVETFKIQIPSTERIIECIEDKIALPDIKSLSSEEIKKNSQKEMYNKLQMEMKKIQRKCKLKSAK